MVVSAEVVGGGAGVGADVGSIEAGIEFCAEKGVAMGAIEGTGEGMAAFKLVGVRAADVVVFGNENG